MTDPFQRYYDKVRAQRWHAIHVCAGTSTVLSPIHEKDGEAWRDVQILVYEGCVSAYFYVLYTIDLSLLRNESVMSDSKTTDHAYHLSGSLACIAQVPDPG